MKKGTLTKKGARKSSVPHLAGKVVTFEKVSIFGNAHGIYYRNEYLGSGLSVAGKNRGITPME